MPWIDENGICHKGRRPVTIKIGEVFHDWTVLEGAGKDSRNERQYLCQCRCGNKGVVLSFHLRNGNSKSCGCRKHENHKSIHKQWKGYGEISDNYWNQIKQGSTRAERSYSLDFDITIEYAWNLFLKQNRCCALTGLVLYMDYGTPTHTASLDRIDSKKGYIEGNVQWVHKEINMLKGKFLQSRFIELCGLVAKYHE